MAKPKEALLRGCAWLVHLYTASGVLTALAALYLIEFSHYRAAFLAMAAALFIDSTDGTLARILEIRKRIPEFDGSMLDNIVDYLNYVLVPASMMLHANILPVGKRGLALAGLMMLASTYGFCRVDAKTYDYYFRGFPSYWNILALYLYLLSLPQVINSLIVVVLAFAVFSPIKFIYPSRTEPMRILTLTLASLWGIITLLMIVRLPERDPVLLAFSLAFVPYYFVTSLVLQFLLPARMIRSEFIYNEPAD
jgi:phosphatidylcholine synthase